MCPAGGLRLLGCATLLSGERPDQAFGELRAESVVEARLHRRSLLRELDGDEEIPDQPVRNAARGVE
jgi:hypothetical protein